MYGYLLPSCVLCTRYTRLQELEESAVTAVKWAPTDGGGDATPAAAMAGGGGATRAMWASPSQTVWCILHAATLEDHGSPTHTIWKPLAPDKDQIGVLCCFVAVALLVTQYLKDY